jgi:hypothetical protein
VGEFLLGYEANSWFGIGAPKNRPTEIVDKLNNEINATLGDPNMQMPTPHRRGALHPLTVLRHSWQEHLATMEGQVSHLSIRKSLCIRYLSSREAN